MWLQGASAWSVPPPSLVANSSEQVVLETVHMWSVALSSGISSARVKQNQYVRLSVPLLVHSAACLGHTDARRSVARSLACPSAGSLVRAFVHPPRPLSRRLCVRPPARSSVCTSVLPPGPPVRVPVCSLGRPRARLRAQTLS